MIAYGNKVKGVFTDKRDGSSSSLNVVFFKKSFDFECFKCLSYTNINFYQKEKYAKLKTEHRKPNFR